jgi:FMN phosphatase YigB (HAD superfamily)
MIFVYDLDLTITDKNGGDSIQEAWDTHANYMSIKNMFIQQKLNGHILMVLSRGVRRDVITFLKKVKLFHFFNVVIGAKSKSQNVDNTNAFWGRLKTKYLKAIASVYAGENLLFCDDMLYNVTPARKAGFKVLHIKPAGSRTTVNLMNRYERSRTCTT